MASNMIGGVLDDIHQVAIEVAFLDLDAEEVRSEEKIEEEEQSESNEWPHDSRTHVNCLPRWRA
jgi:hypothetical protein